MTAEIKHRIVMTYRMTPRLNGLLYDLYTNDVLPIGGTDAVLVHRLRKETKGKLAIITRRRLGYWLSGESRLAIRRAIGKEN